MVAHKVLGAPHSCNEAWSSFHVSCVMCVQSAGKLVVILWDIAGMADARRRHQSAVHSPAVLPLSPAFQHLRVQRGSAQVRRDGEEQPHALHPVASLLSYLTKAPLVPDGAPVVNALGRQRAALENVVRACIGLPPDNNMMLELR